MKGNIILILSLCMICLGINGCGGSNDDSDKTANLSSNLTNETNSTCESNISSLIAQCNPSLDRCNQNLCERCGNDMARGGGQPGTWACSIERLENCVSDNACGTDEEITQNTTPQTNNNTPSINICSDGTIYGGCSITKPNYCDNGNLAPNCNTCGCPPSYSCLSTGQCQARCNDTTVYGNCSVTLPKYCSNGILIDDCNTCGCTTSNLCLSTGICSPTCNDNTTYGNCSLTLPKYCSNGTLIDDCTVCGCPSDQTCNVSICV